MLVLNNHLTDDKDEIEFSSLTRKQLLMRLNHVKVGRRY